MMVRNRSVYSPTVIIGCELAAEADQEVQGRRINHPVAEVSAGQEQAHRAEHERHHVAPLVAVESGCNECPHLVKHEGRSQKDSRQQRDLQVHVERVGGIQIDQLGVQMMLGQGRHDRLLHDREDLLMKPPADAEAGENIQERYRRCAGAAPRGARGSSCRSSLRRRVSGRFLRRDWTSAIRYLWRIWRGRGCSAFGGCFGARVSPWRQIPAWSG